MRKLALLVMLLSTPAYPHSAWRHGEPIPDWVSASCCGPSDAHQLCLVDTPNAALRDECYESDGTPFPRTWPERDGYHIEGYPGAPVPLDQVLPSQDGGVWGFYKRYAVSGSYGVNEGWSKVYCLFLPFTY
jgi:hypothetical protein